MRYIQIYITGLIFMLAIHVGTAQDLPLLSQKLTNSFLYNPANAGNGVGSLTFSNRRYWNNVDGAPVNNFISGHMPFAKHRMGIGFNFLQERVGVADNMYLNAAYAYHINFNDQTALSMGVMGEYTNIRLNPARYDVVDESDNLLTNLESKNSVDFAFGLSFKSQYLDAGISSNRLMTAFQLQEFGTNITQFYTGYVSGKLRSGQDHLIEPLFAYRRLSEVSSNWDVGLFYTYKDLLMLGGSYRKGGIVSPAVSLKFNDRLLVGYTFEMFGNSTLRQDLGGTNEITVRFDFWNDSFAKNYSNSASMMKNSVSFRRKTFTSNTFRSKPMSPSSKRYRNKLKRNYTKSPNYRINRSTKLNNVKTPKNRGKIGAKSGRKSTNAQMNKRRKSNYSKYNKRKKRSGGKKSYNKRRR